MTGARPRALVFLAAALIAIAGLALAISSRDDGSPPRASRPPLLLFTSLPILFSEQFSLDQPGSKALEALQSRYTVVPISVTDEAELAKGGLLLMAQPPAQAPEYLVALDEWVRRGGRVMLLADPMLEWPSERPLGHPLRPPPMFVNTGLLGHWGLRLDAPDERGPKLQRLGGYEVMTASPGRLAGRCKLSADALVADCAIGRGTAIVIADADIIGLEHLDGPTQHNLKGLLAELATLEQR